MKLFGEQKHCLLDINQPYQRPKLSERCWRRTFADSYGIVQDFSKRKAIVRGLLPGRSELMNLSLPQGICCRRELWIQLISLFVIGLCASQVTFRCFHKATVVVSVSIIWFEFNGFGIIVQCTDQVPLASRRIATTKVKDGQVWFEFDGFVVIDNCAVQVILSLLHNRAI